MSLRIVAQAVAGAVYGQALSLGVSDATKKALGVLVPGLPLFLASLSSLCGLAVSASRSKWRLQIIGVCLATTLDYGDDVMRKQHHHRQQQQQQQHQQHTKGLFVSGKKRSSSYPVDIESSCIFVCGSRSLCRPKMSKLVAEGR